MPVIFKALDTKHVRALQAGGPDSNGQIPEKLVSDGGGNPCRHCLEDIAEGETMLALGNRPFENLQAYAECGPIFLCAEPCERNPDSAELPPIVASRPRFIVRGYTADDRISYGTGGVIETDDIETRCKEIFADPMVDFVHIRSTQNNCYFCRVERG